MGPGPIQVSTRALAQSRTSSILPWHSPMQYQPPECPPRITPNIPVSPTQKPKRKSFFTKLLLIATLHVPGIGATCLTSRPGIFSECSILHPVSILICSNYLNPLLASLIYVFQYTSTVLPSLIVPSIACPAASMPFPDLSRRGPSFPVSAPSHLGATIPSQSTHTCKS